GRTRAAQLGVCLIDLRVEDRVVHSDEPVDPREIAARRRPRVRRSQHQTPRPEHHPQPAMHPCPAHHAPRITHCALRTAHYALRTAHYALRTAHYALRTLSALSDAGAQVLLLGVTLKRKRDQAIEQHRVGHAGRCPELREHADGRKAGDGVDLVHVELAAAALEQEVYA